MTKRKVQFKFPAKINKALIDCRVYEELKQNTPLRDLCCSVVKKETNNNWDIKNKSQNRRVVVSFIDALKKEKNHHYYKEGVNRANSLLDCLTSKLSGKRYDYAPYLFFAGINVAIKFNEIE